MSASLLMVTMSYIHKIPFEPFEMVLSNDASFKRNKWTVNLSFTYHLFSLGRINRERKLPAWWRPIMNISILMVLFNFYALYIGVSAKFNMNHSPAESADPTCQRGPTWMWMVVLRSQRTVTSSSGKWTTVKNPAGQMNILCILSTTLDGFCTQTSAVTANKCCNLPKFTRIHADRKLKVILTGFPVSSLNTIKDLPMLMSRDFLQMTPLSKQSMFSAAMLSVTSALLCGQEKTRSERVQKDLQFKNTAHLKYLEKKKVL